MRRPTARSLILDFLSTTRYGSVPVSSLVTTGALFGIEENNIRVALTRLVGRHLVGRDERGRYRLAAAARPVNDLVASWRSVERRMHRWDGSWLGVHSAGLSRSDRTGLRRRSQALDFLGFRELSAGLFVRPNNLAGGIAAVRRRLRRLGLEAAAPVFVLRDLSPEDEERARGLWDVRALLRKYAALREGLSRSAARLPNLPPAEARVESFLIGGNAIREVVLDPLLPEPLVPAVEIRSLVELLLHYDRLGRSCWSGALGGRDPNPQVAPANVDAHVLGGHLLEEGHA